MLISRMLHSRRYGRGAIAIAGLSLAAGVAVAQPTVVAPYPSLGMAGMAVANNRIYYGTGVFAQEFCTAFKQVFSVSTTGTPGAAILDTTAPGGCCCGFMAPNLISSGAHIYMAMGRGVQRVFALGGEVTETIVPVTTINPQTLAVDQFRVYVESPDDVLTAYPRDGGAAVGSIIAPGLVGGSPSQTFTAPGDGFVYYIANGNIFRWNGTSGAPQTLESSATVANIIWVDATDVWWVGAGASQTIGRIPVGGGANAVRHTTLAGTDIFAMVGDATNIYFMADPPGGGQDVIRRLPRVSTTATDVNDVSAGNNTRILCQDEQFLYWAEFSGPQTGIKRNFKNATIARPDIFFSQDRLEVIQSVQDNVNSVGLVGNRPTMVRAYPQASQNLANIGCSLEGTTTGGVPLPGSPIRATKLSTTVFFTAPERGQFDRSFNFILPDSWVALGAGNFTNIRLRATLDPANFIAESSEVNNSTSFQTFSFRKTDTLMIDCRRVLTVTDYTMDSFNFGQIIQKAHQILPFSKIVLREVPGRLEEWEPTLTNPGRHGPWEMNGKQWLCAWICNEDEFVNTILGVEWLLSEIPNALNGFPVRLHRMGMVSPIADWDWGGLAPTFANNSLVKMDGSTFFRALDDPYGGVSMAHELTHNFGFEHVNCGSGFRGGFDDNYYDVPCDVGPTNTGPGRSIAFDWLRKELTDAPNFRSYMSYAGPGWTEPYHWNAIYNSVALLGGGMPASSEALMVMGMYDPVSGAATVNAVRRFDRANVPAENIDKLWDQQNTAASISSIPLNVELLNNLDQPVDAVIIHVAKPCCSLHTQLRPFQAIAPGSASVRGVRVSPQTAADGSATVGTIFRASANAPTVSVPTPAAGTNFTAAQNVTVNWTASDVNGDVLTTVIQYTPDAGATWSVVASLGNLTSHTFAAADRLAGSASLAGNGSSMFRVTVSDGFNTASALSPAFKVANRPPMIQFVSPANGATPAASEQILLEVVASDPEDANLNFYTWNRTRNSVTTAMGVTSEPRLLISNGLAPGVYTINCIITDSGFLADTASITITVGGSFEPPPADSDGDGIPDSTDKCPTVASANNTDTDGDGVGDICDKCPSLFTLTQGDRDADGVGDACDPCPDGRISQIGVDGVAEPEYGASIAVQNTATSAGDSLNGNENNSTGSELDNLHAFIDCDRLFIHIGGNLAIGASDSIDIFIDSATGGQNKLRAGNPAGLAGLSEVSVGSPGMTFEPAFTADYWVGLTNVWQTVNVTALLNGTYSQLTVGGTNPAQINLGQALVYGDGTFSGGASNAPAIRATLDNTNRVGVTAGTGASSGANAIFGVELSIPLSALGNPACDIKLLVVLRDTTAGGVADTITNQTLPGIGGGAALGTARNVNFGSVPGTQQVTLSRPNVGPAAADLEPAALGKKLTVSAPVYAPAPFTIQWRRNGVVVNNNFRISGATTPLLVIDPARNSDLGTYTAHVTTACGTFISPGAVLNFCFADYNESGGVSVQDIFDFLAAYFAGDLRTDFNGSGALSVQDIFDFLAAYFAGCA